MNSVCIFMFEEMVKEESKLRVFALGFAAAPTVIVDSCTATVVVFFSHLILFV
eukprot:UN01811